MKPYYADDAVTLYHGDCREILPALEPVDHVITDPPYEAEAHTAMRRTMRSIRTGENDVIPFDAMSEESRSFVAEQVSRLCRKWAVVFCQVEATAAWRGAATAAGASYRRSMVWVKPDSSPQFNGQGPAQGYECMSVWWCGSGTAAWNAGGKRGVYEFCCNVGRFGGHPTEKPEPLLRALLADFTSDGDVILDPFGGSGTTAVAAKRLGRRCILVEREEKYCEIASKRLSQGALDLFGETA